jgi:CubicO group peptidase (beta-lactamase class C family)
MKKLIVFLYLLPNLVFAQFQDTDSLDAFVAKQLKDYKVPGLAIGIIKENKVIFKKGYGVTSTVDNFPVTTQTIFPLSSCTKAFTAAAMAVLVDEGKINWNDKVIKYLPDFKLSDPWITKELTISDILSHRSGLNSYDGDLLWYGTNYTKNEVVRKIQYAPIKNNFRIDFGYQNVMYLVAGLVIEKVSGKAYEVFVKEKLLNPLSMTKTSTSILQMQKDKDYAQPHLKNKPINLVNMDNIAPAGAINSNIDEMMKWMQMWIGQGRINNTIVINEHSFETITTIKTLTSNTNEQGYGFGWYIKHRNGEKILNHDGGMPGYKSSIVLFPKSGDAIVILTNKISPISDQLISVITEYLTKSEKTNWLQAEKNMSRKNTVYMWDKEREDVGKFKSTIPNIAKYVGEYQDKVYGKASIRIENGKAVLELLPTKSLFTGYLYYISNNKFKIIFNDGFIPIGEIIFEQGADKKVKNFKMNIETGDFHFEDLNFKKVN